MDPESVDVSWERQTSSKTSGATTCDIIFIFFFNCLAQ
jgi:hypothetical protein